METKYEVGGKIRINGEWCNVVEVLPTWVRYKRDGFDWALPISLVEAYEPPVKDEWVNEGDCSSYDENAHWVFAACNKLMQSKYGPPSAWVRKSEVAAALPSAGFVQVSFIWDLLAKLGITPDMAGKQEGGK